MKTPNYPTSDDPDGRAKLFAEQRKAQQRKPTRTLRSDIRAIGETLGKGVDFVKDHKVEIGLGAVAVTAGWLLINGGGGSSSEEDVYGVNEAELDGTIASVKLEEGANIRFDPYVSGENQEPNLVTSLEAPLVIDSNNDFKILDDTDDGRWIGIPVDTLQESYPGFDDRGDNDGIVWVNEQGIDSTTGVDLETK